MNARNRATENAMMIDARASLLIAALVFGAAPTWAQAPAAKPDAMPGMDHGSMQGGSPPPDARDPHAYSGAIPSIRRDHCDSRTRIVFSRLCSIGSKVCARATTRLRCMSSRPSSAGTTTARCSRPRAKWMAARSTTRARNCSGATPSVPIGTRNSACATTVASSPSANGSPSASRGWRPIGSRSTPPPMSANRDARRCGSMSNTSCCSRRN